MVTYAQLVEMDTTKLTSASQASGQLATALTQRGDEVFASADIPSYLWMGLDANAASDLLARLPEPLYDVSDSAVRGQKILTDLADGVVAAKKKLAEAHDAVAGTGIRINPDGSVTTPEVKDPNVAAVNAQKASDAADLITQALTIANDADSLATGQLSSLGEQANTIQASLPTRVAVDRAVDLMSTPEGQITPEIAQELATLLERNDNPEFARQLMEELGAKGLLEKSALFSEQGERLAQNGDPGAEQFKDLQAQLGETLARASQDGGLSWSWIQDLMDAGVEPLASDPSHIGYEALAPLLEHGDYGASFLAPVAEHITRLDSATALGNESVAPGAHLTATDGNPFIIDGLAGGDAPVSNPLNSVMTALDHSPEAAADYFLDHNDEYDHTFANPHPSNPYDAILGHSDKSNIDYVLDRAAGTEPGVPLDVDRVGNALEAAATGVPSDTAADAPRPERTDEMARVTNHLVSRFGGEASTQIRPGGELEAMADNVTDIAAMYMPEIHNSLLPDETGYDLTLDPAGANAKFDSSDSEGLLRALGQHEESAHTLFGANNFVRGAMLAEGYQEYNQDGEGWVSWALQPGANIAEIIAEAAGDEVEQSFAESDASYNKGVDLAIAGGKIAASGLTGIGGPIVSEALGLVNNDLHTDSSSQGVHEASEVENAILNKDNSAAFNALYAIIGENHASWTATELEFFQSVSDQLADIQSGRDEAREKPEPGWN